MQVNIRSTKNRRAAEVRAQLLATALDLSHVAQLWRTQLLATPEYDSPLPEIMMVAVGPDLETVYGWTATFGPPTGPAPGRFWILKQVSATRAEHTKDSNQPFVSFEKFLASFTGVTRHYFQRSYSDGPSYRPFTLER